MRSWIARKAVAASRGVRSGPLVDECDVAMSYHRLRTFLVNEMNIPADRADALIAEMLRDPSDDANAEPSTADDADRAGVVAW
jgi:hypothetical protein